MQHKVERRGTYQGVPQYGITGCAEITPNKKTASKWAALANAANKHARVRCDQCEASMINGIFCHETGCPNTHARYDNNSDTWIKQRECRECGCTVDEDDPRCNCEN